MEMSKICPRWEKPAAISRAERARRRIWCSGKDSDQQKIGAGERKWYSERTLQNNTNN